MQMEGLAGYAFTNGVESDWRGRIAYPMTTYMDNDIQIKVRINYRLILN